MIHRYPRPACNTSFHYFYIFYQKYTLVLAASNQMSRRFAVDKNGRKNHVRGRFGKKYSACLSTTPNPEDRAFDASLSYLFSYRTFSNVVKFLRQYSETILCRTFGNATILTTVGDNSEYLKEAGIAEDGYVEDYVPPTSDPSAGVMPSTVDL